MAPRSGVSVDASDRGEHRQTAGSARAAERFEVASTNPNGWQAVTTNAADLLRALADCQRQLDLALEKNVKLEQDIQQLARTVAWERQHASYDALTGLPNRRLLLDHFNHAAARGARQGSQMALLFLDLDGFKTVNDTLGHVTGDQLLKQVAVRLADCVRTSDTVCRYGGDEFVVLLAEIGSQQCAVATARKIRAVIAEPYRIENRVVRLTTSIGVAVYPTDGGRYEDLIMRSDVAMYFDKARLPSARGSARVRISSSELPR